MTSQAQDSHRRHDLTLISAAAAGDAAGFDLTRAASQIRTCAECASLAADLRAIAAATRVLPAPVRPIASDFRLTVEDVARLDRYRGWGRLIRPFVTALNGPSLRPIAAGLTALGVVGLLVAVVPFAPLGGSSAFLASSPDAGVERGTSAAATSPAPAAPAALPSAGGPVGSAGPLDQGGTLAVSSPGVEATGGTPVRKAAQDNAAAGTATTAGAAATAPTGMPQAQADRGPSWLLVLSIGLLAAGLGLLLLRRVARGRG
jgi:hypothetical protein